MNNSWNYNEFLAFTLLYASHVDIEFAEEEQEKVRSLVDEDTYNELYQTFNDMSDYKVLETILSYKGLYFPTADRKQAILEEVKRLFFTDGEFSPMEKELLHFLDKLM